MNAYSAVCTLPNTMPPARQMLPSIARNTLPAAKCGLLRRISFAAMSVPPVVAPDKNNPFLYDWYVSQSCLSGRLRLELPNGKFTALKDVEFNDAVCCSLSEEYHIDLNSRRTLTLSIMAGTMLIDELTFNSDLICQTQHQS